MYLSSKASRIRQREAQNARNNRAEIVKARSIGQITRRDLYKWGIFTAAGTLALKNGLSPYARSAFADGVPTGTPRSPLFGAKKFTQRLNRLNLQTPVPLTKVPSADPASIGDAAFPAALGERPARRLSYHRYAYIAKDKEVLFVDAAGVRRQMHRYQRSQRGTRS
jgi:hypothetical protein